MTANLVLVTPKIAQDRGLVLQATPSNRVGKVIIDYGVALLALPFVLATALCLLALNPFFNPGPLIFRQERLGQAQRPFYMYKFRTMRPSSEHARGAMDGVEDYRITPLGRVLRKLRIDELPNFFNVLRGEMSVIGPRPDAAEFARVYLEEIPTYASRFNVKPGITGLAQVLMGYAEGLEATAQKAEYDRLYVERRGAKLDAQIALRTIGVILSGFGAK